MVGAADLSGAEHASEDAVPVGCDERAVVDEELVGAEEDFWEGIVEGDVDEEAAWFEPAVVDVARGCGGDGNDEVGALYRLFGRFADGDPVVGGVFGKRGGALRLEVVEADLT